MHDVLRAIPYFGTAVTKQCYPPGGPQDMELCPWLQGDVPRQSLAHQFPKRFLCRDGFKITGIYRDHLGQTQQRLCSSHCRETT